VGELNLSKYLLAAKADFAPSPDAIFILLSKVFATSPQAKQSKEHPIVLKLGHSNMFFLCY